MAKNRSLVKCERKGPCNNIPLGGAKLQMVFTNCIARKKDKWAGTLYTIPDVGSHRVGSNREIGT